MLRRGVVDQNQQVFVFHLLLLLCLRFLLRHLAINTVLWEECGLVRAYCVHQLKLLLLTVDQLQTRLPDDKGVVWRGIGVDTGSNKVGCWGCRFLLLFLSEEGAKDVLVLFLSLVLDRQVTLLIDSHLGLLSCRENRLGFVLATFNRIIHSDASRNRLRRVVHRLEHGNRVTLNGLLILQYVM